jgi:hypothetical protein
MSRISARKFSLTDHTERRQARLHQHIVVAQRQQQLAGLRSWWHKLTLDMQKKYLGEHKRSQRKTTTRLPQPSTPEYDPIPPRADPFTKQQDIARKFSIDHHLKQTLTKHGLGHRLLKAFLGHRLFKALKNALIGALLATSMLSNAYAQTPGTFDPNQPIHISEQSPPTPAVQTSPAPKIGSYTLQRESEDSEIFPLTTTLSASWKDAQATINSMINDLRRGRLDHDWLMQEFQNLHRYPAKQAEVATIVAVNRHVNNERLKRTEGKIFSADDYKAAIQKIAELEVLGLRPENVYLMPVFIQYQNVPVVAVKLSDVSWHFLAGSANEPDENTFFNLKEVEASGTIIGLIGNGEFYTTPHYVRKQPTPTPTPPNVDMPL